MRNRVDECIRILIENGVRTRHRSIFVIIGHKSRDQIVNLYYMLCNSVANSKPRVLWCYRDKLELSSYKKKRAKQVKKLMVRGLLDHEQVDPLWCFLEIAGITYCQYKDSERIFGNTFGMCILEDLEALTPNLLARVIETVKGGGLIILLSHYLPTGGFNESFLLSLASCRSCIVTDDKLNILPISSHMNSVTPVPVQEGLSEAVRELKDLKEQLIDEFPFGPLINKCCTLDQGKAVVTCLNAILDRTHQSTVGLFGGSGRGKSAALGLAIAGAVARGYSNIYVTAPSPGNLKTLFEFVSKGFDMLQYKEYLDYDIVKSSNPEPREVTVGMNIYKQHRQTIQYIQPHEHGKLLDAELLVVDEAASIPLPLVTSLLGPYLVFLSSTVNGYEGSISLKLLQQLEEHTKNIEAITSGRFFRKLDLNEAIRYADGDPVELWFNNLLAGSVFSIIASFEQL